MKLVLVNLLLLLVPSFQLLNTERTSANNELYSSKSELDSFVVQQMRASSIPGLSIAVIKNSTISYTNALGIKNIDDKDQVNAGTIFEAASLSKPVFAYTVFQLEKEGLIDLDKPLFEYLPYPDIENDERYKLITARMVLSHRSGFPNWRRKNPLIIMFTPGSRFSYSGEGYMYLQKVIEKISQKPLAELVKERVFEPLKMANSYFAWEEAIENNMASGYSRKGSPKRKFKPERAWAAGSLHTTASDYAKFVIALMDNDYILSKMTQSESEIKGYDEQLSWGNGLGLQNSSTNLSFWHWGSNDGYKSFVIGYPKQKKALIYFTNSDNGLDILDDLACEILGKDNRHAFDWLKEKYKYPLVGQCP